jgi:serine/threonine protein phosphatase PrpC
LQFTAVPITEDHKPELAEEAAMIYAKGGRIEAFKDPDTDEDVGPKRVWLPDQDMPGLAMSRSLGDGIAHSVGVSSEPEVKEYTLKQEDCFAVIASDGLWEFCSNEEVAQLVVPYYI